MVTIKDILDKAQAEVGITEYPPNSNNVKYNTWYYGREVNGSDYAWCCVFIQWLFKGTDILKKTGRCTVLMDWFKEQGRFYTQPQVGDLVFYNFNKNKDYNKATHIGIVKEVSVNNIKAYEGNTSSSDKGSQDNGGCVALKTRSFDGIIGFGRPDYSESEQIITPIIPQPQPTINKIDFVDVSTFNEITDYKKMAQEVGGMIIRVGYRGYSNGSLNIDKKLPTHLYNAILNKIPVGFYFMSQAINEIEAIEEAKYLYNIIAQYEVKLPIFIDSEYSNKNHNGRADGLSKEQRTKVVKAFCNTIKGFGYVAGVYASENWFKTMLDFNQLTNYYIWCAKYSKSNTPPQISKCDAWQYSSSNTFSWAKGAIDTNKYYNVKKQDIVQPSDNDNQSIVAIVNTQKDNLNVREGYSTNYKILTSYPKGTKVTVLGYNNGWIRTKDGWCSAKYIKFPQGEIIANSLNIREGNGTEFKILGTYTKKDIVDIIMFCKGWYRTNKGWISAKYVKII